MATQCVGGNCVDNGQDVNTTAPTVAMATSNIAQHNTRDDPSDNDTDMGSRPYTRMHICLLSFDPPRALAPRDGRAWSSTALRR